MLRFIISIFVSLLVSLGIKAEKTFRIISYNVENLFDTKHDTLKQDYAFLPDGEYRWTYTRYTRKLDNIAGVIANISGWDTPAIIGLCEVENEHCIKDLVYGRLRNFHYKYIHYESPDLRGIDCALLYDPAQFTPAQTRAIHIPVDSLERPTRDILYAKGEIKISVRQSQTLHIMMCHLPSQRGGIGATSGIRQLAIQQIQIVVDSILSADKNANIIVMGDMNTEAAELLGGMRNLMLLLDKNQGSYKYKAQWSYIDHIYCSNSLFTKCKADVCKFEWIQSEDLEYGNTKPLRTFLAQKYIGGYSDHLPVFVDIQF